MTYVAIRDDMFHAAGKTLVGVVSEVFRFDTVTIAKVWDGQFEVVLHCCDDEWDLSDVPDEELPPLIGLDAGLDEAIHERMCKSNVSNDMRLGH